MEETRTFQNLDELITYLNGYGRFQKMLTTILAVMYMSSAFHMMIIYFVAAEPNWKYVRNNTNNRVGHIGVTSIGGVGRIYNAHDNSRCQIPRDQWKYVEPLNFSIITEFNLSCTRTWLAYSATSTYFFGWVLGSFVLGMATNVYGRKPVVFISCFMIAISGFISAFSPNIYFFLVCRFIIGFFTYGNVGILHMFLGEFVDNANRPFASMVLHISYAVSLSLLGFIAYFIRNWRNLLIGCTTPYLLMLLIYKFIPESLRWLHLTGNTELFKKECARIAKWNGIDMPVNFRITSRENKNGKNKTNFFKLFHTCASIKTTITLMYSWFMACILYYSSFLSADNFHVSIYASFVLFSVIDFPLNILGTFFISRFGRRATIPTSMLVASIISLLVALIPTKANLITLRMTLGVIAQGLFASSFNYLIPWTVEILSTDVRAVGCGLVSGFGRLGGGFSSWLAKGLRIVDGRTPFIVIGVWGIISSGVMFTLPETKGVEMKEFNDDDEESDIDVSERDVMLIKENK